MDLWQLEINVDGCLELDCFSVQQQRLEFPLGHRLRSGFDEQRVPGLDLDALHLPGLTNDANQRHSSLHASLYDSRQYEAQGAANSQARQKENGGYRTPQEPADRPRSVAKSGEIDMTAIRKQILELRDRVGQLVKRYEQSGR